MVVRQQMESIQGGVEEKPVHLCSVEEALSSEAWQLCAFVEAPQPL